MPISTSTSIAFDSTTTGYTWGTDSGSTIVTSVSTTRSSTSGYVVYTYHDETKAVTIEREPTLEEEFFNRPKPSENAS